MSTNAGATLPGEPPKKKKTWLKAVLVILGLFVLGIILLVSCTMGALVGSSSTDTSTPEVVATAPANNSTPKPDPVENEPANSEQTYTLVANSTSASSQVMWGNMGSNQTETFVGTWSKEVSVDPSDIEGMATIYVSNYEPGATGEVSCQVLDSSGTVVEENTASGEMASANCSTELSLW